MPLSPLPPMTGCHGVHRAAGAVSTGQGPRHSNKLTSAACGRTAASQGLWECLYVDDLLLWT